MPRKTNGNTTAKRIKKVEADVVQPPPVSVAPQAPGQARNQVSSQVPDEVRKDSRKNGKSSGPAPVNVEEEIRRRAYELYLQRRATAGANQGDENQDWLVAEQEILSRLGGQEQRSA